LERSEEKRREKKRREENFVVILFPRGFSVHRAVRRR
jgi:hypothetical protein